MAITVTDLTTLDAADVTASLDTITQLVAENNPDVETKSGTFRDLVLYYSAILATANQKNIDLVLKSNSLSAVISDPSLADDDIIDKLASNYFVTRRQGTTASGSIAIVLTANVDTMIAAGTTFTSNGLNYITTATYMGRASSDDVIADTDILINSRSDGKFVFAVPAVSEDVGVIYNISKFSQMTVDVAPPNFYSAYVASDFSGGTNTETNEELSQRLQAGVALKSTASRVSVEAALRADTLFEALPAVSVVGYGDEEQQRYHALIPVAYGGRVDVYARTSYLPQYKTVTKTAVYTGQSGGYGVWQISINRDDFPGFYEVYKVLLDDQPETATSFEVLTDTRGYDVSVDTSVDAAPGEVYIPDVTSAVEAAYSRYSTTVITFKDTITSISGLTVGVSTNAYNVTMVYMPNIADAQDIMSDRSVCSPAGDCLVKAPVPCFVDVGLTIQQPSSEPTLDQGLIKAVVAEAINSVSFTGRLPTSVITSAVRDELVDQQALLSAVSSITLSGRIRKPNGTISNISSSSLLIFTEDADSLMTAKTVAFLCDPSDVSLTIQTIT